MGGMGVWNLSVLFYFIFCVAPAVKGGVAAAVVMEVMRTVTRLIWSCPGAPERVGYVDTPC
jgi:hypothetical protein